MDAISQVIFALIMFAAPGFWMFMHSVRKDRIFQVEVDTKVKDELEALAEIEDARKVVILTDMLVRCGLEKEKAVRDRDHFVQEATNRFVELEDMKKKLAHLRRQIPDAKLREIDDSYHG